MAESASEDISACERLVRYVLHDALDDWVPVASIASVAQGLGAVDYPAALEWTIETARSLHAQGLVRFGHLDADRGWRYYDGSADVVLGDLRNEFATSGRGNSDFYLWLELTSEGTATAQSLEDDWVRIVEADARRTSAST